MKKYTKYLVGGLFAVAVAFSVPVAVGATGVDAADETVLSSVVSGVTNSFRTVADFVVDSVLNWILAPLTTLLTGTVDLILGWIGNSLEWTFADQLINVWTGMLPIANVAFAIVFIIVIYSTATGVGLNNYSVKKILPRLVIVAIAVNVSYYICAAIADLSNIVGANVDSLLPRSSQPGWTAEDTVAILSNISSLGIIIFLVLSLGTVGLALLTIFLSIAARYIVLFLLVAISPLAIVAALLPQTEKWFQKWLKTYVQLIAVYPIFMFAWKAVRWIQDEGILLYMNNGQAPLGYVLSMLLPIAPVFVIMPAMKMGGGLMGKMAGGIQQGVQKSPLSNIAKRVDTGLRGRAASRWDRRDVNDNLTGHENEDEENDRHANDVADINRRIAAGTATQSDLDQLNKLNDEHNTRLAAAQDADRAAVQHNDENRAHNNRLGRRLGIGRLISQQAQFMTGEKGRRWDKYQQDRFGKDEERRQKQSQQRRLEAGRDELEKAAMGAENATQSYDNAVKARKQAGGSLYGLQSHSNQLKQTGDVLDKEIKAEADRQSLGRVGLLDRARMADNRSDEVKAHITASATLRNELEVQAGHGTAHDKTYAEKLQNAAELEFKNAVSRQSRVGGTLANLQRITNAETDRGEQLNNELKTEATAQRILRGEEEGGAIALEGSRVNLASMENREKRRTEDAKRARGVDGGTGELAAEQELFDETTRGVTVATERNKAQTKEREEADDDYVKATRETENRIVASDERVKAVKTGQNETEVRTGRHISGAAGRPATGLAAAKAKTRNQTADKNYQATVDKNLNDGGTLEVEGRALDKATDIATQAADRRVEAANQRRITRGINPVTGRQDPNIEGSAGAMERQKYDTKTSELTSNAIGRETIRQDTERAKEIRERLNRRGTTVSADDQELLRRVDDHIASESKVATEDQKIDNAEDRMKTTFGTRAMAQQVSLNEAKRRGEETDQDIANMESRGKERDESYIDNMMVLNEESERSKGVLDEKTQRNKEAALRGEAIHEVNEDGSPKLDARGRLIKVAGVDNSKAAIQARRRSGRKAARQRLRTKASQDRSSAAETTAVAGSREEKAAQRADMLKRDAEGKQEVRKSERILTDDELRQLDNQINARASRKATIDGVVNTERAVNTRDGNIQVDGVDSASYSGAEDLARTAGLSTESTRQMTSRTGLAAAYSKLGEAEQSRAKSIETLLDNEPGEAQSTWEQARQSGDITAESAVIRQLTRTQQHTTATKMFNELTGDASFMQNPRNVAMLYGTLLSDSTWRAANPVSANYLQSLAKPTGEALKSGGSVQAGSMVKALADPSTQEAMFKNMGSDKFINWEYDNMHELASLGLGSTTTNPDGTTRPWTQEEIDAGAFVRSKIKGYSTAMIIGGSKELADTVLMDTIMPLQDQAAGGTPGAGQVALRKGFSPGLGNKTPTKMWRPMLGLVKDDGTPYTFEAINGKNAGKVSNYQGNTPGDMQAVDFDLPFEDQPADVRTMYESAATWLSNPNRDPYDDDAYETVRGAVSHWFEEDQSTGRWRLKPTGGGSGSAGAGTGTGGSGGNTTTPDDMNNNI